jgi:YVTN family beta-propeller protein
VVVAAIVAVVVIAGGGGGGGKSRESTGIPVGTSPLDAFALGTSVWVANQDDGSLSRIDVATGKVTRKAVSGLDSPFRLGGSGTTLWAISSGSAKVARIDIGGATPKARQIDLPADPVDISVGEGAVWIASLAGRQGELVELDEKTGKTTGDLKGQVGTSPSAVAAGQGAVWVIDNDTGTLYRVSSDGSPSVETSIPVGTGSSAVSVGSGAVWVANTSTHRVIRVDPDTNKIVARITVPASTSATLATGGGAVWWIDRQHGQAVRIDPGRNSTDGDPVTIGKDAGGGTLTAGTLWVTRPSSNSVAKIGF